MELDRVPAIAKYLSLTFFLAWLGRSLVWNFLPIFIERHIASVFLVGVVTSLPAALPIVLDIPIGNLVQRAGEKVVILAGLVAGLFPPLLYLAAVPVSLVAGKSFEGVAKALIWNGGWSISMREPDSDVESESLSVFLLGVNLAVIAGPVLGGYLIASHGFSLAFWLWIFTWLLGLTVFVSYIGTGRRKGLIESLEQLFHRRTYMDDWSHLQDNWTQLKFPLSLIFLYSIIFSFYWLAVPLLLDRLGAGFETMGLIFGLAALPRAFQFLFGDLADRIGKVKTIVVLSLLLTPVLLSMNFVSGVAAIGVLFFVARLFSSGMSPALHALFDSCCPDNLEGEMTGFLEFTKHSGQALGPVIAGTAASIWSLNTSFLAAGAIAAAILVLSVHGLHKV